MGQTMTARSRRADELQRLRKRVAELERELSRRPGEATQRTTGTPDAGRKKTSPALSDQTNILKSVMDGMAEGVIVADTDGRFLLWNRAARELVPTGPTDAPYQRWSETYHVLRPDMRTPFPSEELPLVRAIHGDSVPDTEIYLRRSDSKQGIWIIATARPVRDERGNVAGGVVVFRNSTRRVLAETKLRNSEERFRLLLAAVPDLILVLDAKGRYRNIYTAVPDLLIRPAEELIGRSFHEFISPDTSQQIQKHIAKAIETNELQQFEYSLSIDGEQRWFQARTVRFGSDEDPCVIIVARDINELKQAEERVRRHEAELAHVDRLSTVGEMASELAHELNQPLAAISNYALGCLRRLEAESLDRTEFKDAMGQIGAQAERAGEVIRRIRRFIRKSETKRSTISINELISNVVALIGPEVRKQSVEVTVDAAESLPLIVADGIQIEQVLINLMRNAIEAMNQNAPSDRSVLVVTRDDNGRAAEVSVSDRGQAPDDEQFDQMFDPFFSTKRDGMGMGLTISRTIAEAHNGKLWAHRTPNGGITFHLRLPTGRSRRGRAGAAPVSTPGSTSPAAESR